MNVNYSKYPHNHTITAILHLNTLPNDGIAPHSSPASPECVELCASTLSPREREKAAAIIHPRARAIFIISRAYMRIVIARFLNIEPNTLTIGYSRHGKPQCQFPLEFNLAHTRDVIILAISKGNSVGADIENIRLRRPLRDIEDTLRFSFGPKERRKITDAARFVAAWTRKEAIIKMVGGSTTQLLDTFHVPSTHQLLHKNFRLPSALRAAITQSGTTNISFPSRSCTLHERYVTGGYRLCIAISGSRRPIQWHSIPLESLCTALTSSSPAS